MRVQCASKRLWPGASALAPAWQTQTRLGSPEFLRGARDSALQCVAVCCSAWRYDALCLGNNSLVHMQAGQLHHCHKWRDTHPAELPPKTFRDEATRMRKCQAGPLFLSAPSHHVQSGTPSLRTSQALSA